jgi:arylsulfatase A-like enzyme
VVASALAGLAVGLLDGLFAWGAFAQFVPGVGGRLQATLLSATLLGLATALLGPLVIGVAAALGRHTALARIVAKLRSPENALVLLSLVIAGLPVTGGALAIAYRIAFLTARARRHVGLVTVVTIAVTLAALLGAVLLTFALGRLVELALRRVVGPRVPPVVPWLTAAGLVLVGLAVGYGFGRQQLSLDLLALRPIVVALAVPVAIAIAWRPAARLHRFTAPGLVAVCLLGSLLLGAAGGPRKAATAFTGLSGPIVTTLSRAVDLDRDGYSSLFGGGDCNDLDRDINPGAFDLPDDGVDQNCTGADLSLTRAASDVGYVPLPASIPADTNIIFITFDAFRADHVGAYGYPRPTTPTIDAIAREGTVFENAWAHAPSTRYSIPAILTGRYPSQVLWDPNARTAESWWPGLKPENTTLAELARAGGLTTAAFTSYHYFDRARRMDQGFDSYDNSLARLHQGADPAQTEGSSARELADKAIAFVQARAGTRFFLWVHFYDTHYKWQKHEGTPGFGTRDVDLYDHELRYTDDQLGRLVAELKAQGIYDKTVFVITGDHGEGFGEHKITFHGYDLYAAQTKVPLVIRVPGLPAQRATLPVGHVDLLPTIGNLVGGKPEETMVGRSLVGPLTGAGKDEDREVYQEVKFDNPTTDKRAVATQRWHLLYNMIPANTWELYDVSADPMETRDLSGLETEDVRALRAKLLAWIDFLQFLPGAGATLKAALSDTRRTPSIPLTGDFGGKIRLYGADLPATARPGESLATAYYFEPLGQLTGDYRIFVHIEGPTRFQDDHAPLDGLYPVGLWRPGTFVTDARTLTIPANARPGVYTVYLGFWRPGKARLALTNAGPSDAGQDRVQIGTLLIQGQALP